MYEIYYLKGIEWVYFISVKDLKELDKVVYKLTILRPNKSILVLQDGNEFTCLNGTEYQYWWFKNHHIRQKKCDYVKTFKNNL